MPATATITGRIAEPVLRWTQGGHAVLELSIAATPRRKDRQSGEWADDGAPANNHPPTHQGQATNAPWPNDPPF